MHRRLATACALAVLCQACSIFEKDEADPPPPAPAPAPAAAQNAAPIVPPPIAPAFDPNATGTRVLARYQNGALSYAAVVTQQSGADNVNVVYADGDVETLPISALVPDSLAEGSRVQARIRAWPRFFPGTLQRRIGHAVFVRFDDGDEQWTSIGLLNVAQSDLQPNGREGPLPASDVPMGQVGAQVVANYQSRGWYYAGVVVETRPDGAMHVIYADGDREWLPASSVRPDSLQAGARVQARLPRATENLDATIRRRVGHAVELQLDDGQKQWVALANVRVR